jgi:hypothetical protein
MRLHLLAFSDRMYQCLLRAYPAAFQERFAGEMAQVFHSLSSQFYADSGGAGLLRLWLSVLWDSLWAAITQWRLTLFQRRLENMETNSKDAKDGVRPLSPFHTFLATLPFLLFGASVLISRLEVFHLSYHPNLALWQVLVIQPGLVFNWLVLVGLGAGLLVGFPRWVLSYLGWALLFAWWWSNMSVYGYHFKGELWLPLAGVFLIVILIRRSLQPLRGLLSVLWADWTLPSLGLYILYGWMYMLYDENHHPLLLVFIAVTTLAVSLGAWGYFRAASPMRRVLALAGGMLLATTISAINYATWDYQAYYGFPEGSRDLNLIGIIFFIVIALLFFGNGVLARWRITRASRSEA